MQVLFRLAYALVVGILISLFVVLGTHSLYDEPDFPTQDLSRRGTTSTATTTIVIGTVS